MPPPELHRDIIVIGASAGGVSALQRLVNGLPEDLPAALFVVMHVWSGSETLLPQILARAGKLPAREAKDRERIEAGCIYVAPVDQHLFVEQGGYVSVLRGPKENRARPAINPLFRSAATAYGNRVIGIMLTGTLDDGAAGLWAIKRCGGIAIAQADAEFPEMPRAARESVELDHWVPLAEIPPLLVRLTREPLAPAAPAAVPDLIRANDDSAKMRSESKFKVDEVGRRSIFTCPECNGPLWELDEGSLQYRCHVGHAFSGATLNATHDATIEQSLWTALRALKESAALDERLATQATEHNLADAANAHHADAHTKLAQADHLQQYLLSLRPSRTSTDTTAQQRSAGER